jgi:hypothetical protein
MKRCLTLLVLKGMQIKSQWGITHTPAKSKRQTTSTGKNVEKLQHSCITGRIV